MSDGNIRKVSVAIVFAHWWGVGGGLHRALATLVNVLSERDFDVQVLNWGIPDIPMIRKLHDLRSEPSVIYGSRFSKYVPYLLQEPILELWEILMTIWLSKRVDFMIFIGPTFFHPARYVPYSRNKTLVYLLGPKWNRMPEIISSNQSLPKKMLRILYEKSWPGFTGPSSKQYFVVHNSRAKALVEEDFHVRVDRVLGLPAPNVMLQGGEKTEFSVIDFGRLHPEKRHELSIDIIERVAKIIPTVRLYIVGLTNIPQQADKVLSNFKRMINQKSLQQNVVILQNLPHDDVIRIMKSCKIILSNQIDPEAWLLTLLQGMACGCVPVIPALRRGAWEDILDYGKYGFGFADADDAAIQIARILSLPPQDYQILSDRAHARATSDLGERRFGEVIVSIIKEVSAR